MGDLPPGRDQPAVGAPGGDLAWRTPSPSGIRRLFVANRGEIARRILATCQRLGIEAVVAPLTGPDAVDLLDPKAVVAAARAAGADALHPGYGFLAESADFAREVLAAGLRWVGPPPEAMAAMGDKAAARRLAARLGIPVLPGYDGPDQDDDALLAAARQIGPPLLVKPAGGGGGKGMRIVHALEELPDALAASRREAMAAVADDRLILERYLPRARHVEVQVLFDGTGAGVHLGERDCSLQRRFQKVLEEAPAPGLPPGLRQAIRQDALRLASAVGYVSAGTVEFVVSDDGSAAYFMEMNTRLQVEHPVTEALTGRDLVADQLAIAAGVRLEELGLHQDGVEDRLRSGGHAIEVRLYAEDPEAGFLPATGRIVSLRWPTGPGIRVDAGVDQGDAVGDRFDPLLAKIVAHGSTRDDAMDRLRRALDETVVLGLTTNLRFLRWLLRQEPVVAGRARTDDITRLWQPLDPGELAERIPPAVWEQAARLILTAGGNPDPHDLWGGGWRITGGPEAILEAEGIRRRVVLPSSTGEPAPVERLAVGEGEVHVDVEGRSIAIRLADPPRAGAAASHRASTAGGRMVVAAPMPGAVLSLRVRPGQAVEAGAILAVLEAMKMEHPVTAPVRGVVDELLVGPGSQVGRGDPLAVIDVGGAAAAAPPGLLTSGPVRGRAQ
jgi:acetyl/propionyl-CoA carboxylase alpha subunit